MKTLNETVLIIKENVKIEFSAADESHKCKGCVLNEWRGLSENEIQSLVLQCEKLDDGDYLLLNTAHRTIEMGLMINNPFGAEVVTEVSYRVPKVKV